MENFMALLNKRNIPYQYSEGYIRYKKNVRPQVEEIEGLLSHTQSIQFKNEKVRKYFRDLLDEEGVEYLALEKENGSWTMWWPHSDEQERALSLKTVEYAFEHKLHKEM